MRQSPPPLTRDRVLHLINRMKSSRVAVVGDIMLDRYLVGDTERLSPEAPVPEMRYLDTSAKAGEKHRYAVATVNSAGLASKPTASR